MFNEDELYIKVAVLDEIYNFIIQIFFYLRWFGCPNIHHNILELIPKESKCFIVISVSVVVVKDLGWRSDQNNNRRYRKVL
jgi:hypothetical protein